MYIYYLQIKIVFYVKAEKFFIYKWNTILKFTKFKSKQ